MIVWHGGRYVRRRLVAVLVVCAVVLLTVAVRTGVVTNDPPPLNSPDILEDPHP